MKDGLLIPKSDICSKAEVMNHGGACVYTFKIIVSRSLGLATIAGSVRLLLLIHIVFTRLKGLINLFGRRAPGKPPAWQNAARLSHLLP